MGGKKNKKQELMEMKKSIQQVFEEAAELETRVKEVDEEYLEEKQRNQKIQSKITTVKKEITHFQKELEKHEQMDEQNLARIEINEEEDNKAQLTENQTVDIMQRKKQAQQMIDKIVKNKIDTVCIQDIFTHIEQLEMGNMNYIVKHADKQAIFRLKNKKETFGQIKESIAEYFGLPPKLVFLENENGEILLSKNKVIDELFPLHSCKIKKEDPVISVTF